MHALGLRENSSEQAAGRRKLAQRTGILRFLFLVLALAMGGTSSFAHSTSPLVKVGEARLKVMFWSIYDSRLYTPSGQYVEGERPLRLEIDYRRDVSTQALVDNTRKEWSAMGRTHPRRDQWLATLSELWPDIKENDVLRLELDADGVSTFTHNDDLLGRIEDPEFGQQFVDIWLSEDCTRPALRTALLGKDE